MSALSRRDFLPGPAPVRSLSPPGGPAHAAMRPNDKFDLVIKGGEVLDPSQRICAGRPISASARTDRGGRGRHSGGARAARAQCRRQVGDAGLVDLHSHMFPYGSAIGIPADELVRIKCTTTCVSAGDAGANNFAAFRRYIVAQTRTRLYAFIHIANTGLTPSRCRALQHRFRPSRCLRQGDRRKCRHLLGVKVRMSENVIAKHGLEPLKRAILACEKAGTGAQDHVSHRRRRDPELMRGSSTRCAPAMCSPMRFGLPNIAGPFTNIVQDGKLLPAALEAKRRGGCRQSKHHAALPAASAAGNSLPSCTMLVNSPASWGNPK